MISLLIFILVVVIVCAVVGYIIRLLPLGQPWQNIALAVLALVALLVILQRVVGLGGIA